MSYILVLHLICRQDTRGLEVCSDLPQVYTVTRSAAEIWIRQLDTRILTLTIVLCIYKNSGIFLSHQLIKPIIELVKEDPFFRMKTVYSVDF